ncbi:hypothetical protein PTKIN_Ptkin06aG0144700 [Pterospermum kingtungense]
MATTNSLLMYRHQSIVCWVNSWVNLILSKQTWEVNLMALFLIFKVKRRNRVWMWIPIFLQHLQEIQQQLAGVMPR